MTTLVEDCLFDFVINTLSEEQQKQIYCGNDILRHLEKNPDAKQDLLEEVWNIMKANLRYNTIIQRIKDQYPETESESEEEEDFKEDSEEEQ